MPSNLLGKDRLLATEIYTRPSFQLAAYKTSLLSCPTTEMNVALRCTASSRQSAPPTDLFFRQPHGCLPSCHTRHFADSLSVPYQTHIQHKKGHVHLCYATAAQPQKQRGTHCKPDSPDISELKPHLQKEWHPDKDALLGGVKGQGAPRGLYSGASSAALLMRVSPKSKPVRVAKLAQ